MQMSCRPGLRAMAPTSECVLAVVRRRTGHWGLRLKSAATLPPQRGGSGTGRGGLPATASATSAEPMLISMGATSSTGATDSLGSAGGACAETQDACAEPLHLFSSSTSF